MSVYLVTAANQAAANTAAGEQMFTRQVPDAPTSPTHYVAGWDLIPADTKAAILAAGAVEYDTLDAALTAAGVDVVTLTADERLDAALTALAEIDELVAAAPVLIIDVLDVLTDVRTALEG